MLLRIRGAGASAENCQAIVMHLRALKHHVVVTPATSSVSEPIHFHDFPVTIDCSHSKFLPTWHEVWNLYDIAYDEVAEALTANAPSYPLVYHLLKFADAHSAGNAFREAESSVAVVKGASRIVINALGASNAAPLLSLIWQLAYAAILAAVAAHHQPDSESTPSSSTTLQDVVILIAEGECINERRTQFVEHFALHLFRPFASPSLTVRFMSTTVDVAKSDDESNTVCFMPDTDAEWVGDASEAIQQCPVLRVPIRDFVNGTNLSAMTLQEMAAVARENMVKNFCPCCGPTDRGGCSGHSH